MNEFYFFYKKKKELEDLKFPLIYGLTASPMKTGIKGESLEAAASQALQKLSENLDCVVVVDPGMINSNANEMRSGETIEQFLNDDTYIEAKDHVEIKEYKKLFVNIYNYCFIDFMKIGFSQLLLISKELPIDITKQYEEYLILKFKAPNLDEYNKVCQRYSHLYNLKIYSPFFLIFEKIQRHIFMILENLCLDSLLAYFYELIKIYKNLYQKKYSEDKNNNYDSSLIIFEGEEIEEEDEKDVSSLDLESINELKKLYLRMHKKLLDFKKEETYISDRLHKLYIKIDELFKENNKSKIIIFIANRIVAHFLKPALNSYIIYTIKKSLF